MKFSLQMDGNTFDVELRMGQDVTIWVEKETFHINVKKKNGGFEVLVNDQVFIVDLNHSSVTIDGHNHTLGVSNIRRGTPSGITRKDDFWKQDEQNNSAQGTIFPPMPGRVIALKAQEGDTVKVGTPLLLLEAMKMQNEIVSPMNGVVKEIKVTPGSLVEAKDILIVVE